MTAAAIFAAHLTIACTAALNRAAMALLWLSRRVCSTTDRLIAFIRSRQA